MQTTKPVRPLGVKAGRPSAANAELEQDIYKVEQFLRVSDDLDASMGLYNLLAVLISWR